MYFRELGLSRKTEKVFKFQPISRNSGPALGLKS